MADVDTDDACDIMGIRSCGGDLFAREALDWLTDRGWVTLSKYAGDGRSWEVTGRAMQRGPLALPAGAIYGFCSAGEDDGGLPDVLAAAVKQVAEDLAGHRSPCPHQCPCPRRR